MSWPVKVKACHTLKILGNAARKFPYQTTVDTTVEQMKRSETKRVDELYTEGKPTCREVCKLICSILIIR
jgi:hypothetical protein